MIYVDLGCEDYRPVQVEHDLGVWCDGWLEAYRKLNGVWSGYVRYSPAPGVKYLGWFAESHIRGQ